MSQTAQTYEEAVLVENEQKAVWKFIYIGCREHLSVVSNYKKIRECGVCLERWVLKFESREELFEACKRKGRLLNSNARKKRVLCFLSLLQHESGFGGAQTEKSWTHFMRWPER